MSVAPISTLRVPFEPLMLNHSAGIFTPECRQRLEMGSAPKLSEQPDKTANNHVWPMMTSALMLISDQVENQATLRSMRSSGGQSVSQEQVLLFCTQNLENISLGAVQHAI